jgi:hypothetical protein
MKTLVALIAFLALVPSAMAGPPFSAAVVVDSSSPPKVVGRYFPDPGPVALVPGKTVGVTPKQQPIVTSQAVYNEGGAPIFGSVLMKFGTVPALVPITRDGFYSNGLVEIRLTPVPGGGDAIAVDPAVPLVAVAGVQVCGNTLYIPDLDHATSCNGVDYESCVLSGSNCEILSCRLTGQGFVGDANCISAPEIKIDISTLNFTPPFHVKR